MRGGSTEPKFVSKSTYHRHSQYRNPITPMSEFLAQRGIATTSSHLAATIPASQGDSTRQRSHSPIAASGPSEQPNKRQRPNEEDIVVGSGFSRGENGECQEEGGSQLNSPIDPGFMQVLCNSRMICKIFSLTVTMPILQLPPGTPPEVRGPDNEEDNNEFNNNNMNQFVRLFLSLAP